MLIYLALTAIRNSKGYKRYT